MLSYLKAAFLASPEVPGLGKVPINALACLGVGILGFAFPPLWLLGLGLETAYLFGLATHPRFRKYVDAHAAKAGRQRQAPAAEETAQRILRELPPASVQRFEALRRHCQELRRIAANLRHPDPLDAGAPLEDLQVAGLDRLLWIYLRLLFTQHMLRRVFENASEQQVARDIRSLEEQIRLLGDDPRRQKARKTLEDNLETCRQRLANFQAAREKGELVNLEIDRLENKIRSLSELAVSRDEPNYIAGQVDHVAASMVQTERTMQELQFATGLASVDEDVPQLLPRETVAAG
jgi:hypothetical protein